MSIGYLPVDEAMKRARGLTPRQLEVARLVALGHSNGEIAQELGVSETTIKNLLTVVMAKLGHVSRVQVAVDMFRCGMMEGIDDQD